MRNEILKQGVKMKIKKLFEIIVIVLIIVLALSIYNKKTSKIPPEKRAIKIGAILPLTGNLGFIGESQKKAISVLENIGEIRKRFVVITDARSNKSISVNIANKLTEQENIEVVLTTTTGISRSVLPVVIRKRKLFIPLCMDYQIQKESPLVLRFYYSFLQEGEGIVKSIKLLKWNKIAILYLVHPGIEREVYDIIVPLLKKDGIEVSIIENYEFKAFDFKNIAVKIKNKNIKNVILLGYGNKYKQIFKSFEEMKLDHISIIGGWGFLYKKNIPRFWYSKSYFIAPENFGGEKSVRKTKFYKDFLETFNEVPNFDALIMADAILFIKKEINKGKNISQFVKELNQKDILYNGLLGSYLIKKGGDLKVNLSLFKYNKKNNILEVLKDVSSIY